MPTKSMSIAHRAQALALLEVGIPLDRICAITKLSKPTIYRIRRVAKNRGYDAAMDTVFKDEFFTDAARSGRPRIFDRETEHALLGYVEADRAGRESTVYELAREFGMSHSTAWRILRKPTWKPGLTQEMQAARLQFALDHQHWTLEDWKNVIWTDETSIVLGHRRGAIRVWRRVEQRYDKTVIRRRWK